MEQQLKPETLEKGEKKEGKRKQFEYRDAEGGLVCKAEIVYSKESVPIPGTHKGEVGKEVLSYKLMKEQNGKQVEIDLFALTKIDAAGYRVFVRDGFMMNQHSAKERVIVAEIESPLGVATFLHEAGHAAQSIDPAFKGVNERYSLPTYAFSSGIEAVTPQTVEAIAKRFGLEKDHSFTDSFAEYTKCAKVDLDLRIVKARLERRQLEVKTAVFDPIKKTQELHALEQDLIKTHSAMHANIEKSKEVLKSLEPIIRLPQRALERDATKRAIEWMTRILEDKGINLFVDVKMPESALENEEVQWHLEERQKEEVSCDSSVKRLMKRVGQYVSRKFTGIRMNARKRLQGHGLATYGAQDEQMKKTYGFIPELINEYQPSNDVQYEYQQAA